MVYGWKLVDLFMSHDFFWTWICSWLVAHPHISSPTIALNLNYSRKLDPRILMPPFSIFKSNFARQLLVSAPFFPLNFVLSRSLPTKWHSHSKDYSTYMILDPRILMSQFSDFKSNFTFSQTNRHPHDKAKNTQNHTAVCICRHRLDTQTKTLFPF